MTAVNQDITLPAGDYREIEILVTKKDKTPIDPDNLSVSYSFSKSEKSASLFTKSSDNNDEIVISTTPYTYQRRMDGNIMEVEEIQTQTMLVTIKILPDDTKDLRGGFYYQEAEAFDTVNERPYTLMKGKVNLLNTIIRSGEESEEE